MKALIITYYWPPAGGSGVQRWLKFVKYLPLYGISPVVYVPENADYPTIDEKLLSEIKYVEVLKHPIFNPQDVLRRKKYDSGVANVSKGGFLSWIRGNFFIPDAKIFWVKPSVKFLLEYIKKEKIEVVISSGPPHSMHLIAEKIKRKTNVKWIADFRDPWTTLYYAEDFNLTKFAKAKNEKLEQNVLQNADVVITVSKTIQQELAQKSNRVEVITNGYDDEVLLENVKYDDKFSIAHIGLLPRQSNPTILWQVLQEISNESQEFKKDLEISLTGNVNEETLQQISDYNLNENLRLNGYVSHLKAVELQKQAQVLLLLIPKTKKSKGILTGKLFEYLTSKRPILAIGDTDGDVAEVLTNTKTGEIVDFEDEKALKTLILNLYAEYKLGNLQVNPVNTSQYHRKKLTEKLAEIIKNLIEN